MPAPRRPLALPEVIASIVVLAACAEIAACSLDWTVRSEPSDAAAPDGTAPIPDAAADAPSPVDAGTDGATVDCAGLTDAVAKARAAARVCTLAAGHCTTSVKDACDCDVVVAQPATPATVDYQNAVAALKASSCNRGCTSGCPSPVPQGSWACLQSSGAIACFP